MVVIPVDLSWDDQHETEIRTDMTAEDLVLELGQKYGFDESYCQQCCIKTIGEASYLLGSHKLSEYAFIQEKQVPQLVILDFDSIEIDMANDAIYISLEKDVESRMSNGQELLIPSPIHSSLKSKNHT